MNRALFAFSLAVLLWLPQEAAAKALTVRVTISGGGLTRSIDVADPQVLNMSAAWGDTFLDVSRPPLDEAPKGRARYEVSFYSEVGKNDVRKTQVLYYYPGDSTARGLVYLPGKGAVWALNAGTILRRGREGKWSYASAAWDSLVKSIIAREGVAVARPPVAKEAGRVRIDGWTKPQRGWLYIVDRRPESEDAASRVWLFDPAGGRVMGCIDVGYQPDIVLSHDGTRLYVASGERESGELAIIDTGAGTVRHIRFPERVLYTPWYRSLPPFTSMMLSSDEKALWILGQRAAFPEQPESQVLTLNIESGRFLGSTVAVASCTDGKFLPATDGNRLEILCSLANTLHSIHLNRDYGEASSTVVKIPGPRHCLMGTGFFSSDGRSLVLLGIDGSIQEMDTATNEFRSTGVRGECSFPLPTPVYSLQWPRSPDGTKLYVGYGPATPNNLATSSKFQIFDTVSWRQLGTIQTSIPFWSAVTSEDGALIYAFAPEQRNVLVIDAITLTETRKLSVGNMPAFALISP